MNSAIDVFCGCGGLSVGLKRAGFTVIGALDNNPLAIKTYNANHHDVKVWNKDIRDITIHAIKRRLDLRQGQLDLLAGCPPCQGFTSLRTLNGSRSIDDPRNELIFEFFRLIKGLRPKAIMMENVPELALHDYFTSFLKSMKELGYIGRFDIFNAEDFRVPQRRERLIYMAGLGFSIPFASKSSKKVTVKDKISRLPKAGHSGDFIHDIPEQRTPEVMKKIRLIPKDGGSRTDLPKSYQLECHKKCNGFKDIYGRLSWNKQSPTITSGCFNPSKGRFLHPEEDRAITMREAAILQGFPRWYKFRGTTSKTELAKMIGNALPPPFIRRHAYQIRKVLTNNGTATE